MVRQMFRAAAIALGVWLAAAASVQADTAPWFEYFVITGSHSAGIAALQGSSSGKPTLRVANTGKYAWQEIGADGSRITSPPRPENLRQLVDAWPDIYGDQAPNAILSGASRSKSVSYSVSLPRPELKDGLLIFKGISPVPLSPDLQRAYPKIASNLSTSFDNIL